MNSEQFAELLLQSTRLDDSDVQEYLQRLKSRRQQDIVSDHDCYFVNKMMWRGGGGGRGFRDISSTIPNYRIVYRIIFSPYCPIVCRFIIHTLRMYTVLSSAFLVYDVLHRCPYLTILKCSLSSFILYYPFVYHWRITRKRIFGFEHNYIFSFYE